MAKKVVTFGEIMMRLSPPGFLRFEQAHSFDVIYGGGEANVAVSLANYGIPAEYVTRLPKNEIGDACVAFLRRYGVGTRSIVRGGERLGIYFLENGAVQRGSQGHLRPRRQLHLHHRAGHGGLEGCLRRCRLVPLDRHHPGHLQGRGRRCLEAASAAREMGLTVSCDLNYRAKLWKWGKSAGEVMAELVKYARRRHRQRGGRREGLRHQGRPTPT